MTISGGIATTTHKCRKKEADENQRVIRDNKMAQVMPINPNLERDKESCTRSAVGKLISMKLFTLISVFQMKSGIFE